MFFEKGVLPNKSRGLLTLSHNKCKYVIHFRGFLGIQH